MVHWVIVTWWNTPCNNIFADGSISVLQCRFCPVNCNNVWVAKRSIQYHCCYISGRPWHCGGKGIWAATCDFQQCGMLTWINSDQPVEAPVKLRSSKCCSVSSLTVIEYSCGKQRLRSDCAYEPADLSLCWSHIVGNLMSWFIFYLSHINERLWDKAFRL